MGKSLIIKDADFSANGIPVAIAEFYSEGSKATAYNATHGTVNVGQLQNVLSKQFVDSGSYYVVINFSDNCKAKDFADGGGKFNILCQNDGYKRLASDVSLNTPVEFVASSENLIGATNLMVQGNANYASAIGHDNDGTMTIKFYKKV